MIRFAGAVLLLVGAGIGMAGAPLNGPALPPQRFPIVPERELPLGLGIGHVMPRPGSVLNFYGEPRPGDVPGDLEPVDVVRFGVGVPSVQILEAPPWLVPQHLKMDYELFQFRVLTLSQEWAEVIGNTQTGQSWWIERSAIRFESWPEFLLGVNSVEALDAEANPVRERPFDQSSIMSTAPEPVPPLAVRGEWLKVGTSHLADRIRPEGWIRWRDGERLLIAYNPLS